MSETTLVTIVAAVTAAFVVFHALSRRSVAVPDEAAGTLPSRTDHEPAGGSREHAPLGDSGAWESMIVSDLSAAEELLDLAEAEGYRVRELCVLGNSTFLVRWRDRAGGEARDGE